MGMGLEFSVNSLVCPFSSSKNQCLPTDHDVRSMESTRKGKGEKNSKQKRKFRCGESNPDLLGFGTENERC